MDFLTRTIGSLTGLNIPFTIGEQINNSPIDNQFPSIWAIHHGVVKSDSTKCTLFIFDAKAGSSRGRLPLAKNMLQKLKKLRIPGVLKILDSYESDTSIIIATEHVVPLYHVLDEFNIDTKTWGLDTVFQSLSNIEASHVHGNFNLGSIFVTDSGEWVIGGLELTSSINENVVDDLDSTILTFGGLLPGYYAPPEVVKDGWQVVKRLPSSVDSWQAGLLIYEIYNGSLPITGSNKSPPSGKGNIPSTVIWNMQKTLLNQNARSRARISKLLENPQAIEVLRTEMSEISSSLNSLTILSDYQFGEFLDKVVNSASKFPSSFTHYKLLPELVKCLDLGKGGKRALTTIIEFSKDLPITDYQRIISPIIVNLYASPDRVIRLQLLESLPDYIEFLDSKTVSNKIFSHLATGFSDTEPVIREQTLKSVLLIVDKLTSKQLNGELLRLLAKTQNDSIPEIRANTTILLGRISDKFSPSTRSNVLVAAYTRALRDQHIPSRLAALLALAASIDYFSPEECCSKLMGALCPSLLDKDESVRKQALVTVDTFLNKIKKQAENMSNGLEKDDNGIATDLTNHISRFGISFSSLGNHQQTTSTEPPSREVNLTKSNPVTKPITSSTFNTIPLRNESPANDFNPFQPNLTDDSYDSQWAPQDDENDAWGSFDTVDTPKKTHNIIRKSSTLTSTTGNSRSINSTISKKTKPLSLDPEDDDDAVDEWSSWD